MENQSNNFEDKIMGQIKCGKVKLRSRYIFWAENFGLRSAFVLSLLLGVLAFTLVLFYLQATDNLIYLSFGRVGMLAFLESFPYYLVIGFIILIFLIGIILKKSELFYKFSFSYSAVSLLVVVVVGGAALAYTQVPQFIEEQGYNESGGVAGFIRPFLHNCFQQRKYGISGRITEMEPHAIVLQTPDGLRRIDFSLLPNIDRSLFEVGKFVVLVGNREGDLFYAKMIQVIDQKRIPMIHRGLRHRFPSESMRIPPLQQLLHGLI
jgi:hypothetical protein